MQKIRNISFNRHITVDGQDSTEWCSVGSQGVTSIEEVWEYGGPVIYEVNYENGNMLRIHNPCTVLFMPVDETQAATASTEHLEDLPF